jgi:DNA/RNA endonuclease YhcR with UshA esterase domain
MNRMKASLQQAAVFVVLLGASIVAAGPAIAHHGFADYDMTRHETVTGKVRAFQWTNPHTWLWLDVPDGKGGITLYAFEGMSPNYLGRRGWTQRSLQPGDQITVNYFPFKDAKKKGGTLAFAKKSNGEILNNFVPANAR